MRDPAAHVFYTSPAHTGTGALGKTYEEKEESKGDLSIEGLERQTGESR
jgi:hypothetical protein